MYGQALSRRMKPSQVTNSRIATTQSKTYIGIYPRVAATSNTALTSNHQVGRTHAPYVKVRLAALHPLWLECNRGKSAGTIRPRRVSRLLMGCATLGGFQIGWDYPWLNTERRVSSGLQVPCVGTGENR